MIENSTDPQPIGRRATALGALVAIAAFYFWLTVSDAVPVLGGDHPVYLLMADYFSPMSGRLPALAETVMQSSQFPPLYPMLLGLLGGTTAHVAVAHAITTTFLIAALALLYLWGSVVLGSRTQGLWLAVAFAFMPGTLLQSLGIMSEGPYLTFTLWVLWLADRAPLTQRSCVWLAVLIGAAWVTRTAGVALVAAFGAYLLAQRVDRPWRFVAISLVPMALWQTVKFGLGYGGGYWWFLEAQLESQSIPSFLAHQLVVQGKALAQGWVAAFHHFPSPAVSTFAALAGLLGILGCVKRVWQRRLDGYYVACYLGLVLLWPFPLEAARFVFVVVPIVLVQGLWFIGSVRPDRSTAVRLRNRYVALAGLVLLVLPGWLVVGSRLMLASAGERNHLRQAVWYTADSIESARTAIAVQETVIRSWRKLASVVPENECVYHVEAPMLMMYVDRVSYPPPLARSQIEFDRLATACRHFLLGAYVRPPFPVPYYPRQYLSERATVRMVARLKDRPDAALVAVLIERSAPAQRNRN